MDKTKLQNIKTKVLWTFAMAMIAILMVASVQRKMNADVEKVVIAIKEIRGDKDLINKKDVQLFFREYLGYDLNSAEIKDLDLREMESMLNEDERVKISQIFIDANNRLNIWVIQKQPIVRIMDGARASYYLDEDGNPLAVRPNKAIRVPIATGNIELYRKELLSGKKESRLREVFEIAKHVQKDDILRPLIEQIDVDANNEITLIPKIGRHELTLGDARDLEDKFDNLKVMYREGLPRVGWRKYSILKLNWKGQVAAKKK